MIELVLAIAAGYVIGRIFYDFSGAIISQFVNERDLDKQVQREREARERRIAELQKSPPP